MSYVEAVEVSSTWPYYDPEAYRQTAVEPLTDNTAGTGNDTLQAMAGVVYSTDIGAIRNNFADLARKVNEIHAALVTAGIVT